MELLQTAVNIDKLYTINYIYIVKKQRKYVHIAKWYLVFIFTGVVFHNNDITVYFGVGVYQVLWWLNSLNAAGRKDLHS